MKTQKFFITLLITLIIGIVLCLVLNELSLRINEEVEVVEIRSSSGFVFHRENPNEAEFWYLDGDDYFARTVNIPSPFDTTIMKRINLQQPDKIRVYIKNDLLLGIEYKVEGQQKSQVLSPWYLLAKLVKRQVYT